MTWLTAPHIMAVVAAIAALLTIAVWTTRARSDGAVYARRIVGTMLGALAIVLAFFAWSLAQWSAQP